MLQPSNLPNSARFLPFLPLAWPPAAPCLRDLRDLVVEKWLMVEHGHQFQHGPPVSRFKKEEINPN